MYQSHIYSFETNVTVYSNFIKFERIPMFMQIDKNVNQAERGRMESKLKRPSCFKKIIFQIIVNVQGHHSLSDKTSCRQILWSFLNRKIGCSNDCVALKFDSAAVDVPVKFRIDSERLNPNPTASILHKILQ